MHFDDDIFIEHNEGYVGNVHITTTKQHVQEFNAPNTVYKLEIPFEHLKKLVIDYFRAKAISNFESMTYDDMEEWLNIGFSSDGHTEKSSLDWMDEPHGHH
jgi:hypothetical protein